MLAAFGWGALVLAAIAWIRRRTLAGDPMPVLGGATVAAATLYGVLGTLATIVQKPLPWRALAVVGWLLALAAIALFVKTVRGDKTLAERFAWVRRGEVWLAVAFSALVTWHVAVWPVIGWDGRSIWIFRAKQMAYDGFLTAADATSLDNFFSHMEYPLLFPSWLIQFAGFGGVHERQMSMGMAVLFLGLFACLWVLGRRRLGRWAGAAFASAVMFAGVASIGRGYADPYVSMFALIGMLCLDREELEPLGWAAVLATALTKREGLIIAAVTTALFILFHPRFRAKRWLARFAPGLILAPAAAHVLWTRAVGIKDTHAGAKLPATWKVFTDRLHVVASGIMNFERQGAIIALGTALMIGYAVLEVAGYRAWLARIMALTGLAVIVFGVLAMLASPYDLTWQINTALDRVLAHAALFFFAAVLVALVSPRPAAA
jgi:hypothetical protein